MITIYTPTRASGYRASFSFSTPTQAQAWIDRQITGGDDGDWAVGTSYVYTDLDEHDKDKGVRSDRGRWPVMPGGPDDHAV